MTLSKITFNHLCITIFLLYPLNALRCKAHSDQILHNLVPTTTFWSNSLVAGGFMKYEYSVNVSTKLKISIFLFESIPLHFNAERQEIRKKKSKNVPWYSGQEHQDTRTKLLTIPFLCAPFPVKMVCLKSSEESKKNPKVTEVSSYLQRREHTEKTEKSQ